MKKIFLIALSLVFASSLFSSEDLALARARAELEKISSQYAEFEKQKAKQTATFSARTKSDIEKIKKLDFAITEEKLKSNELSSSSATLSFLNNQFDSLSYSRAKLSSAFGFELRDVASFNALAEEIETLLPKINQALQDPLAFPVSAELTDVKGKKVSGKIYRVGAFEYFVGDGRAGFVWDKSRLYGESYAKDIREFILGKTNLLPADFSDGVLMRSELSKLSMLEEIHAGGVWMIPILFLGVLSIYVVIRKSFSLLRIGRLNKTKLTRVLNEEEKSKATSYASFLGKPYSVLATRILNLPFSNPKNIEEASFTFISELEERLCAGLSVLSVSASVAPLLGLLGTVTGIIKTFGDLSFDGAREAQSISAGISEALITTEYGLIVAIPAFVFHAIFSRRAKSILADVETLATSFINK